MSYFIYLLCTLLFYMYAFSALTLGLGHFSTETLLLNQSLV